MKINLKDGRLSISIDLDTLIHAVRNGPYFDDLCMTEDGEYDEDRVKITDPVAFAKEIIRELKQEDEDGTTLVHRMFDKAAENAFENGAEGIEFNS